jgi:hypothetical protein
VINGEMLHTVNKERSILDTKEGRNAYWSGHILRRNYLLKQVVEGKIEVTHTAGRTPLYD